MIESCNKNRMLLGILCLGGLTIIVLVVESHWAGKNNGLRATENASKPCWETEEYEVVKACHPCTEFEIASNSIESCTPTKFKETIKCVKSGTTQRSCEKVAWIEEKKYWLFEVVMFIIALVATTSVLVRNKILERRAMQRLQKQLSSGLVN